MKALSIRQPWAWLITHGHKDIENRSWNTHQRGPILIHASAQLASKTDMEKAKEILRAKFGHSLMLPERKYFSYGAIIGVATITGCVEESESPWFFGPKGFTLADAKTLKPVSIRGRLSFFETGLRPHAVFSLLVPNDHTDDTEIKAACSQDKKE
ncbi:TPA: ASCH domain-containing protein [Proteus mirabilis]|uniref:ASCH domain-containing protein n=2 Tax=Morganellaceae TaxID=1903414 RepID=A0AAI9MUE6_MORMO|nr:MULTISPECIES: ASCH domain-containing protein [Providencia]EJV1664331.1 ASCH domain-containing protein [Klebsiella pneumoniae]EKW8762785.1 ASCH domain-containing protein [Morganella morganii]THB20511.1 ASCH domain-containing protein [Providencia sp. MGF014]HEJ9424972.1 ASCH domain-containing protein [Proteus mirabilis]ELI9034676.1 ASCH domain-containing protein [Morganella morganii]